MPDIKNIEIRSMRPGEEQDISSLIVEVYMTTFGRTHAKETQYMFCQNDSPAMLEKRIQNGSEIITAINEQIIIGMLEIANAKHIARLYVDPIFHKNGIAKMMLRHYQNIHPSVKTYTTNSSEYALNAYKALGFIESGNSFVFYNEIRAYPMTLILKTTA